MPPIVDPANERLKDQWKCVNGHWLRCSFSKRLLASFMEGFKGEIDRESGRNTDLVEEVMLQYAGTAYVGVIEWWIKNGMPYPPRVIAKQVGALLGRTL
ncbi:TetR-like C-terminal domain-containing protein [Paenibacillus sp. CCS19]|uniref:TetR-like C-terminal domain-containing protein n=1 Tax=Paenibacillus sp. CCS19 TaxID=3158387 RepID=UPI0032AFFD89